MQNRGHASNSFNCAIARYLGMRCAIFSHDFAWCARALLTHSIPGHETGACIAMVSAHLICLPNAEFRLKQPSIIEMNSSEITTTINNRQMNWWEINVWPMTNSRCDAIALGPKCMRTLCNYEWNTHTHTHSVMRTGMAFPSSGQWRAGRERWPP